MRFVDSNVFLHAFLRPRRPLQEHESRIKKAAREILLRLEEGEETSTTVVHLSEVANILEARMLVQDSRQLNLIVGVSSGAHPAGRKRRGLRRRHSGIESAWTRRQRLPRLPRDEEEGHRRDLQLR